MFFISKTTSILYMRKTARRSLLCWQKKVMTRQCANISTNIDVRDSSGDTALSWSAYIGNYDISEKLLLAGADPNILCCSNRPILNWVCTKGFSEIVMLFIEYDVDLELADPNGKTVLFEALTNASKCLDVLLAHGVNVNHKDNRGNIPIMFVNTLASMNKLLSYGSCVNYKNHMGKTPLMCAAKLSVDLVERLVQSGADVNAKCLEGLNAAFVAISYNNSPIVEFFLRNAEFDCRARDDKNNTLLHYAFLYGLKSVIPNLMDRIDVLAINKDGESVLDCSLQHNNIETLFYLIRKDIRIIDVSKMGMVENANLYVALLISELKKLREKNGQMANEAAILEADIMSGKGGPEFVKAKNSFNRLRNM